ncbi:membrane dipeptidase [uncultured Eudoraea sp.]|uniref:membrane dipeptidase n=1 Tax=uncultured Eudoraea sp. TaxID=1035614 RepID=UPI00260E6DF8|nr:membrane dipeptidase [uncultured Eudoraea sp.]
MHFNDDYIDFHCHPSLKPFGKSFNYNPTGVHVSHRNSKRSIWHYDPPSISDKLLNYLTGLTKFSQANFTSLVKGGVGIVCVSLYPLEKWFVRNKMNNELLLDLASNFALGIGHKRINYIQGITDYFKDVEAQYDYYMQLDGKIVHLPEGKFRYKLVKNFHEIQNIKDENTSGGKVHTICVIISIEGLHVLNTGLRKPYSEVEVLTNLDKIKNWEFRPFFITIAHHFWNQLCGHSESLTGIILKFADQKEGLNSGFTAMGRKVMERLVDNTNNSRIIPDIKHMSIQARKEYYQMLDSGNSNFMNLPVIASHAACNGLKSFEDPVVVYPRTASKLNPVSINLFDEEIIRIAKSKGIIGLQLDERRIVNKKTRKKTKNSTKRSKIMHYRSELLWNQIQHIAEVLDAEGLFAWDCMAIGSDFDGIIDSLNGFWTAEELPFLADFLERHAYNYMLSHNLGNIQNVIKADEIIARLMSVNGRNFLKEYFK